MAGALSAGGLRMIVAHLIAHRYVDCLVSTGANLYHDLHETRGQPSLHRLAARRRRGAGRRSRSIASTTPTPARKSSSTTTTGSPTSRRRSSRGPTRRASSCTCSAATCGTTTGRDGILTAAYRANVPIFCPAIADSSIGMGLSQARQQDGRRRPHRHHRRHRRVGEPGHPAAADGVGRARRRHAEELHQPGERAGRVLQRPRSAGTATRCRSSPTCRTSAARPARASKRRRAGASWRPTPRRSRCRPTRRSRCRCWPARWRPPRRRCSARRTAPVFTLASRVMTDRRPDRSQRRASRK